MHNIRQAQELHRPALYAVDAGLQMATKTCILKLQTISILHTYQGVKR